MFLNPCRLAQLAQAAQNPDSSAARDPVLDLKAYHVLDCFECASCSFSCPSHIPLVQLIRMGKAAVRQHTT